jgi:site-specific recombinase XerD
LAKRLDFSLVTNASRPDVMAQTRVPAGRRELTRAHLRFYKAVMEGVELPRAWSLYLPLEDEYRAPLGQAMLGWIRQTLITEALAAGQPALIGLIRRDPRRIRSDDRPSLQEFASRFADAGDFSEGELTALWQQEFGTPSPAEQRRERLARRLRDALAMLERAGRRQPDAADPVGQWLAPRLARRLLAAGLHDLGAVRASLAQRRSARWGAVPGVGAVWADRLTLWLDEHGIAAPVDAGGIGLPALLPLERFDRAPGGLVLDPLPPAALGALPSPALPAPGANRLGARDDRQAIELWLQARAGNAHTRRAYRRVAERLLLWCHHERRIDFRQLNVADCIHYRQWLNDLGRQSPADWSAAGWRIPAEQWIGRQRAARRDSAAWRPFDGPLSRPSVAQDLLVVKALFSFLLKAGYIDHQPWDLLGRAAPAASRLQDASEQFVERSLDPAQWAFVLAGVDAGRGDRSARLNAVLWLGFACGLRAAEMLSLTLGSLLPRAAGWRLRVLGKGGKTRTVPLPSPARDAVLGYLAAVGLPLDQVLRIVAAAGPAIDAPLLRSQRGRRSPGRPAPSSALSYTTLYGDLKRHLAQRAADLGNGDPVAAAKLAVASTHWLRHTCATLALKSGVPLNAVQRVLGHASLQTTSHYLTEQQEALQTAMEGFAVARSR